MDKARAWLKQVFNASRVVDELECVASVLLAIVIAHLIHAQNVSWAAFSGYMVMRGYVMDSLLRGTLRIVGTVVGVVLVLALTPLVEHSVLLSSLACALIGGVALYGSLTGRRSYAWLFVGLTFGMSLLDRLEHPGLAVWKYAETRLLEVIAGTGACILVSTLSAVTARRRWPGKRAVQPQPAGWHPHALRHAAQGAVALALLPWLGALFAIPQLSQSAISIMAVMLVPISSIGVSGFKPVSRKLLQRVAGCCAGAALAAVFLYLAHGSAPVLLAGTVIGVVLGRHIENGGTSLAYVGTQFTLAVLVTLVPDTYADAAIAPAEDRLIGILVGMLLLEPILFGWHVIGRISDQRPLAKIDIAHDANE